MERYEAVRFALEDTARVLDGSETKRSDLQQRLGILSALFNVPASVDAYNDAMDLAEDLQREGYEDQANRIFSAIDGSA